MNGVHGVILLRGLFYTSGEFCASFYRTLFLEYKVNVSVDYLLKNWPAKVAFISFPLVLRICVSESGQHLFR